MNSKVILIFCVVILLQSSFSNAQSRKPFSKKRSWSISGIEKNTSPDSNDKYFDLVKILPEGYVENGSVDYTNYIQKGIDENRNVQMPNFPILINEKGLKVKSNSRIVFKKKSALLMAPNSLPNYAVLLIFNVSNVVIQSPVIVGERNLHKGDKGEWGMGIFLTGSQNIQISSATISNCWGDGIYIGGDGTHTCENIKIIDAKIDSCRRNGISITDGKDIQLINPMISNSNGTAPMAGIDIEPNNNKATIDNILINNPITLNNAGFGIAIVLAAHPSEISKIVRIKIDNHIDKKSNIAFWLAGFRGDYGNKTALTGSIEVNNPKWYDNKNSLVGETFDLGPKTKFKNIKIYKKGSGANDTPSQQKLLEIKKEQSANKNISIE